MNGTFEKYIFNDSLIYKYAKGRSAASGAEIHPYHEILYFLGPEAEFISESDRFSVKAGTLFVIPKETYHIFSIGDQEKYLRSAMNFPDYPELYELISSVFGDPLIKIYEDPPETVKRIFERLNRSFEDNITDNERKILLSALFRQLLVELKICGGDFETLGSKSSDSLISRAIEYIGIHLFEDLTIERVACALNVSKSLLSHCFKRELNISPHRYISEKRLVYAHKLIEEGVPATEASLLSGHGEYSTFYRAYKKMFGENPSRKKP